MSWVTSLSNLSSFTLEASDVVYPYILQLTQLSYLENRLTRFEDLSAISNLQKLITFKLSLNSENLHDMDSSLKTLVLPPTLLELQLRSYTATITSPQWTTLERLHLSICKTTTTELEHLIPLTRLTCLSLEWIPDEQCFQEKYDSFKMFELPQIKRFALQYRLDCCPLQVLDEVLGYVPNCTSLRIHGSITDVLKDFPGDDLDYGHEWKGLGSLTKVTKLDAAFISQGKFGKQGLAYRQLTGIQKLTNY